MDGILKYHIPPETEDYTVTETDPSAMEIDPQLLGEGEVAMSNTSAKTRSNLRLFTPPLFSRQGVPQNYKSVSRVVQQYGCMLMVTPQLQSQSRVGRDDCRG